MIDAPAKKLPVQSKIQFRIVIPAGWSAFSAILR